MTAHRAEAAASAPRGVGVDVAAPAVGLSTGRFGLIVVAVIAITAIVARFWTPFDPQ